MPQDLRWDFEIGFTFTKCFQVFDVLCIMFQNKKQRMMVRQAVLKGKDPFKLLEEMEIIDKMGEYPEPQDPNILNDTFSKLHIFFSTLGQAI